MFIRLSKFLAVASVLFLALALNASVHAQTNTPVPPTATPIPPATQVAFSTVITNATSFSNGYGNYIVAAIIIAFGLLVVARLMGRRR